MDYWNGETEPDSDQFEGMDYYILGNLGGEKPGRPPAELNQGPPTLSLRQDKKERTSHRTAAPAWASSTLSPVRARNLQILRYFLAQPPPFRCQTRLAAVISAVAHRASKYGRNTSSHVRNATTIFIRAPLYAPCGTISPLEAPARDNLAPCGDRFR